MPGKRVIRISVFSGYTGETCLVSTAHARTGRTPRNSEFVPLSDEQVKRFAEILNDVVEHGCGDMYAHPACGFVWYR